METGSVATLLVELLSRPVVPKPPQNVHLRSVMMMTITDKRRWSKHESSFKAAIICWALRVHFTTCLKMRLVRLMHLFPFVSMPLKKPLIDERAFQQVRLSNGIAVTLISDKRSEKSSCALSIGFGAAKDSLPGLAHMTEHAVFLGSEKYPEENAYKKFLNKNGGGSNGATGMEYTLYKFYVNSESFEGALDIFAQFFKSPLLAADSIKREVHAVDSEDSKNRNLDNRRALQVLKDIMDLGISYSKYSTGNLNTLVFGSVEEHGDILVQSVQDFHRQHYLPGKMNLCLVGPQSLQELERLATTVFSDISNPTDNSGHSEEGKSSLAGDTPSHSSGVFMGEDVQQSSLIVQLRPAKDIRDISFMWTLPFVKEQYRSDPAPLITYLLNQGEEGTLLATLQDLGLATAVSGSYRTTFTDPNEYKSFAVYEVSASLTEEGLRQWPVVRQYIMQSLQQIASLSEDQARQYWEEIQAIGTLSFAFQSQPSAYEQAASAAYNMLDYHLDDVLCGDSLVGDLDLHRFQVYCQRLLTAPQVILLRSRSFHELPETDEKDFIRSVMAQFEEETGDEPQIAAWRRDGTYFHRLRQYLQQQRQQQQPQEQRPSVIDEANTSPSSVRELRREPFYGVPYHVSYATTPAPVAAAAVNVTRLHRPSRFICRNLLERIRHEPQVFQEQLASRKLFSSPPSVVSLHIPPSPTATVAVQEDGEATTIVPRINEEENASYGTPPPTTTAAAAASMWISRDEVFCTPKSMLHVFVPRLVPPHITSNVHPRNALYNTLLDQVISREFWDAYAAGLSADVSWSRRGLSLKFRGYSEGLFPFAQLICHQLLGHASSPLDDDAQQQQQQQQQQGHGGLCRRKITPVLFENFKERQLRSIRSWKQNRPDNQAQTILSFVLGEGTELPPVMLSELEKTTMEDLYVLEEELQQALRRYFHATVTTGKADAVSLGGVGYLHGSFSQVEAQAQLASLFTSMTQQPREREQSAAAATAATAMVALEEVQDRARLLPSGQHTVVTLPAFNDQDVNHAYVLYFQTDERSPRNSALMLLLRRLWAEPAFNQLRTQQQLGYIVSFGTEGFGRGRYGVRGFEVRVLSKRFDPSDIEHAVEGFVQRQVASLHSNGGTVLDSDVVAIAKSIITTLRDPPTSYAEEANEFWSSITSEFPFDWQDRVIAELETIHLADVQDFVATYIASPSSRKSIAVHIYGSVPEATAKREAFLDAVQRGEKVFLGAPMQALSTVDEISSWRTALPWSTKATSF